MPREILSTNAPLSAAGSAAQRAHTDEDHSSAFIRSAGADRVSPGLRPGLHPGFHMVAGGAPVIEPVVEGAGYQVAAGASHPAGEVLAKDWAKDWAEDPPEDLLDSIEARTEARMDNGGSRAPFLAVVENGDGKSKAQSAIPKSQSAIRNHPQAMAQAMAAIRNGSRRPGLKKLNRKQVALDWPPT